MTIDIPAVSTEDNSNLIQTWVEDFEEMTLHHLLYLSGNEIKHFCHVSFKVEQLNDFLILTPNVERTFYSNGRLQAICVKVTASFPVLAQKFASINPLRIQAHSYGTNWGKTSILEVYSSRFSFIASEGIYTTLLKLKSEKSIQKRIQERENLIPEYQQTVTKRAEEQGLLSARNMLDTINQVYMREVNRILSVTSWNYDHVPELAQYDEAVSKARKALTEAVEARNNFLRQSLKSTASRLTFPESVDKDKIIDSSGVNPTVLFR